MEWISYAYGKNHYEADPELRDLLRHFWPGAGDREAELLAWGAYMGREVYEAAYHIDQDAGPELVMHDLDGNRVDRVRLSPVQREVLKRLRPIVRPPYEGGSWHHHFALGYLLADGGLYCILTITHQVAYPIHKYAPGLASWKERVLYGEAFGATWMTEIQGGSDLGANRTVARREGEVWRLYGGDKYFASGAGLADVALVTARPELRRQLWDNVATLYDGLKARGFTLGPEHGPVVGVLMPDRPTAIAFWRALLDAGIYVNVAVPPATPNGVSLLRCSLCAVHTREQLEHMIEVMTGIGRQLGVLPGESRLRAAASEGGVLSQI